MVNSIINAVYYFSRNKYFDSNLKQNLLRFKVELDYETNLPILLSKIVTIQPNIVIIDDNTFAKGYNFVELFALDSPFFVPSLIIMTDNLDEQNETYPNVYYLNKESYLNELNAICSKQIENRFFYKNSVFFPFTRFDEIFTTLRDLGINTKSCGSIFLKECINAVIINNCKASTLNKNVYTKIATNHNTTITNVERCIRAVVNTAWKTGKFNERIAESQSGCSAKPTVKELIFYVANLVRDKETENKFKKIINPELVVNAKCL